MRPFLTLTLAIVCLTYGCRANAPDLDAAPAPVVAPVPVVMEPPEPPVVEAEQTVATEPEPAPSDATSGDQSAKASGTISP